MRQNDTTFLLDRRLVDLILEEQADLMYQTRVVPRSMNGQTYPQLWGVGPSSLLGMLGFRNGDCVQWINGFDLSTPDHALEAYARLRSADVLEVRVKRNGADVTLEYELW